MSFKELKVFFDKVTSWPQLISKLLVAPAYLHIAASVLKKQVVLYAMVDQCNVDN